MRKQVAARRTGESLVTIVVGTLIILFGLAGLLDKAFFVMRSDRATAKVVSAETIRVHMHRATNNVTIEFQTRDGVTRRAVIKETSNASTPSTPGAPVDIFYLRSDPTRVRNDSTPHNWGIFGGIAAVGVVLVAGAIWTGKIPEPKRRKGG